MLMDLLKWTFLILSLRRISALGKGKVEVSRRLQTQSPVLTHLDKVDFVALDRIGMLARQVPCPCGMCVLRRQGGGLNQCMAVTPDTSGCLSALSCWKFMLVSSWGANTSSFWYWWNGPQDLLPDLSPIKASCSGYCVATGWREGWQQIACLIYYI